MQLSRLGGIEIGNKCVIRDNTCANNANGASASNIRVVGTDNRIEGNTCTEASRGIRVEFPGNFIARNTCANNTTANWDVVSGNACLVVNAVTSSTAIIGNAGGVSPGSTDPNANSTH